MGDTPYDVYRINVLGQRQEDLHGWNENENHNPGFTYGGRSVNNHHYIPRQDFNNNDGADKIGNGSGYW